jgi:hypothetical protein
MRIYDLAATEHAFEPVALRLAFADVRTEQYLWVQREECSEDQVLPDARNIWIERDDQRWGGSGGITAVVLERDALTFSLTPAMAARMGGFGVLRVNVDLDDTAFAALRELLLRVFQGYDELVRIAA